MGLRPTHPSLLDITLPPVTGETPPVNNDQSAVPLAVVVSDAHGEDQGVLPSVVAPECLALTSFISDNALILGRIPATAPSATALGKSWVREYGIDPQARASTQFSCTAQRTLFHVLHFGADCDLLVPLFPGQASASSNMQNHPDEGVLPEYNGHISYSPSVNSSMFNAAHILEPTANVYQPRSAHTISSDPALTYLPGYWAIVKLQDFPATEPGEGTNPPSPTDVYQDILSGFYHF
ncbi:hypothetical protein B0H14DRAFT_2582327 [Mycena olivaceomarginata]|nr:hypothetical protein B0H14DRAFT_2582327 [Mycena olivaceomarginata]